MDHKKATLLYSVIVIQDSAIRTVFLCSESAGERKDFAAKRPFQIRQSLGEVRLEQPDLCAVLWDPTGPRNGHRSLRFICCRTPPIEPAVRAKSNAELFLLGRAAMQKVSRDASGTIYIVGSEYDGVSTLQLSLLL